MLTKKMRTVVLITTLVLLAVGAIPSSASPQQSEQLAPNLAAAAHRLGAEMRLSPSPECDSATQWNPAVAHNPVHGEYLVAWTNEWPSMQGDIYARRVSESGQVLDWFCVATGLDPGGDGKSRFAPSVAYNAANDEYLVVWMHEASGGVYKVWGRRISWDGPGSYPEFPIITATNRSFYTPRVAWNSSRNEYLVIWNARDTSTWQYEDVAGYRVSADGVVQNPGSPLIITTSDQPERADLVYSAATDRYMVVWTRYDAVTGGDIYGAFLDADGATITPPGEFPVYDGPYDQDLPAVTSNEENRYIVVWSDAEVWGDIYGRLFRANGSPVADRFALASTADYETGPDVAANATGQYLVVWSRTATGGYSIAAQLCNSDGTLAAPVDVFAVPSWNAQDPAVACAVPGCLAAYSRSSSSVLYQTYGRLYWPQAIYLPLVLR